MHSSRAQAGFILIPVLLILALLVGLAVALNTSVIMDSGLNGGYNRATAGFYAAESGLDVAMDSFRNKFLQAQLPCSGTSSTCSDFNQQSYMLNARTVNYQLQDPGGNPQQVAIPAGHVFAGLNSLQYTYLVNSQSVNGGVTESSVGAQFNIENIPLFQFLAFYTGDLEILPGANMTMHGRIHTNGDLYMNSNATLTVTTSATPSIPIVQVTAKNSIHRGRKDQNTCGGAVQVQTSGTSPTLLSMNCNAGLTSAVVPTPTLAAWKGSLVSGVNSITVPTPGVFSMPTPGVNSGGQYWESADLRIALQIPTGAAGPLTIEVLDPDPILGYTVDATLTTRLNQFINDATFNNTYSAFKGTKPIFISDVPQPTPGPGCNCNLATTWPPTLCSARQQNCYWGTPVATFTPTYTLAPTNTRNATTTKTPNPTATNTPTPTAVVGTATPTFGNNMNFSNLDRIYSTNTWATLPTPTPGNPTPAAIGSMYTDSDPRRGGFYNWREQKWMYLLNINLRDLLQWNINYKATYGTYAFFDPTLAEASTSDPTHTPKSGLVVYFTVVGPNSNAFPNNYGVRIFGSNPLPFPSPAVGGDPTGITVVSDQAVYIAGDYNVAGTYTIGGTSASYIKQPAAIMADSINVLSNNALPVPVANPTPNPTAPSCTNDCQSILSLPLRPASLNTGIYAAFIGGVDVTAVGNYNGGLENYPRFHEDWTTPNSNLTYRGSFVSLGTPSHVNGIWCNTGGVSGPAPTPTPGLNNCNIYNPPNRLYDYDADFNDVRNLPPMTPTFVYVQQIVFTENFN